MYARAFLIAKHSSFLKTKNDKISYMYDILITCRKYLQEGIISLRGEVWTHQTSFTPVLFIEETFTTIALCQLHRTNGIIFRIDKTI
jgi:hypothetical protein